MVGADTRAEQSPKQKAVLVTGASTGIGRNMAERLASEGYFVYAGARKEKDLQELNAIENIQSIRLDVIIQEEIDAALHALFDDNPLRRYMVVPNEREAQITIKKAMQELVQLNEWQAYSYDREALIAILDEVLAESEI